MDAAGANARAVAEHALSMILALLKELLCGHDATSVGTDRDGLRRRPRNLRGKRVGILGAGNTAVELLRLIEPFDCRLRIWTRHPERHQDLGSSNLAFVGLEELFENSDVVSLHLPLTRDTRALVGPQLLMSLPPDAIVVNAARKELLCLPDLADILATRRPDIKVGIDDFGLAQYALTQAAPYRVLLSPHVAGVTVETLEAMQNLVVDRIVASM